jgi:DNA-binding beta-propeller fold protein YncE
MPRVHVRVAVALLGVLTLLSGIVVTLPSRAAQPLAMPDKTMVLPGGGRPLDLDDMVYSSRLGRVVVPGAQAGNLDFIDPATGEVSAVSIVKPSDSEEGGVASAALAGDYLFTADATAREIAIVDLHSKSVVGRTKMAGKADYLRHVATTDEIWVTEPREAGRIEIFAIVRGKQIHLVQTQTISTPGGPESLVLDEATGHAFTNTFGDKTMMIEINSRSVAETWSNGCGEYTRMARGARGLAYDAGAHILYVACMQGKVIGLDVRNHGKVVSTAEIGASVDIIAFNAKTHHLFAPSTKKGILTVFETDTKGALRQIAQYQTAQGSHCVVSNDANKVYVCDPMHGQVFEISDPPAHQ